MKKAWYFRCIKNHRLLIGIAGIFLSLMVSLLDIPSGYKSISAVFFNVDSIPFYLCIVFCVYVFADCFCEDMEYRFYRNILVRESRKAYISAHVTAIFITSAIAMTMGMMLFLFVLRVQLPWVATNDSAANVLMNSSSFRNLLYQKHYIIYFFLGSVKVGLLGACLSLVASYMSLFVKNKLLIYATPVMVFYLIVNLGAKIPYELRFLNLYKVFMPIYNVWGNDLWSALWTILVSLLLTFFLGLGIYRRMGVLVRNE